MPERTSDKLLGHSSGLSSQRLDVAANMGGFLLASGLALAANLLVVYFWGQSGMGVFIQAFALYILATQIGVFGTHNAALTFLGRWHHKGGHGGSIVLCALVLSLVTSLLICALVWGIAPLVAKLLHSPLVQPTLRAFLPAILLGSLIKVVMAALNGASMLRHYAFLQGFRAVLIFCAVVLAGLTDLRIEMLPFYIGIGEAVSLLLGLGMLAPIFRLARTRQFRRWLAPIGKFGALTLPYGLLAELNTKIDVLILGFFASDAIVGVYAFAALLAEGFANLLIVFRTVLSPKIARALSDGQPREVERLFAIWRSKLYGFFLLAGVLAGAFIWLILPVTGLDLPVDRVVLYFALITGGVVLAAAHMPFNTVLMLGGKPGMHSAYFLSILAINALGNIILTPLYGAMGTAIATSISFVIAALLLVYLAKRTIGVRLY